MAIQFLMNGTAAPEARYVTWAPSPCALRLTGTHATALASRVHISNRAAAGGGRLLFYTRPDGPPQTSLRLLVPPGAATLRFWTGGRFGSASRADRDTSIVFSRAPLGPSILIVPVMVRIRKNANNLTDGERDRFIAALAQLNDRGTGPFRFFRDMHVSEATDEGHFDSGFLPWHRAYLLDLERELQAIDPSVALPYWRFDAPAPRVFDPSFLGDSNAAGTVQFAPGNPLRFWMTSGVPGVIRRPEFDATTEPATDRVPPPDRPVLGEAQTLALGQTGGSQYSGFRMPLENNPHGRAHVSFGGVISDIGSAPRDPLFFLLHGNVDRLWAKWQWAFHRFDSAVGAAFTAGSRVGHRLADTMWPWNGDVNPPRPSTAPGGVLRTSLAAQAPSVTPAVVEMIDYQGVVAPTRRLGFDYDDVPYEA